MRYTKEKILDKVMDEMENPATLYKGKFANYNGRINDGPFYIEVAADEILNHIDKLKEIKSLIDDKSLNSKSIKSYDRDHKGEHENQSKGSLDSEKYLAKTLYNICNSNDNEPGKKFDHIGKIFDYEIPLATSSDDKAGRIDVVSFSDNSIYLLELKKKESKETLLRCALEIYTYYRQLNLEKFIDDFRTSGKLKEDFLAKDIVPAVLVFKEGRAYKQYKDMANFPKTRKLMDDLGVQLFVLGQEGSEYKVSLP